MTKNWKRRWNNFSFNFFFYFTLNFFQFFLFSMQNNKYSCYYNRPLISINNLQFFHVLFLAESLWKIECHSMIIFFLTTNNFERNNYLQLCSYSSPFHLLRNQKFLFNRKKCQNHFLNFFIFIFYFLFFAPLINLKIGPCHCF